MGRFVKFPTKTQGQRGESRVTYVNKNRVISFTSHEENSTWIIPNYGAPILVFEDVETVHLKLSDEKHSPNLQVGDLKAISGKDGKFGILAKIESIMQGYGKQNSLIDSGNLFWALGKVLEMVSQAESIARFCVDKPLNPRDVYQESSHLNEVEKRCCQFLKDLER